MTARISNFSHYDVWDEITNLFPNVNGGTVEVYEWISNVISRFTWHVIRLIHASKMVSW